MKRLAGLFRFPWLPVWLAAVILLAPVALSGRALFWGTPLLQFGPWWSLAWETLLSGRLPLWNRWVGMGTPLLANYQSGLLYPPTWLYLMLYALFGSKGVAWGMAPVAALHLAWSGIGMAFLARRLGIRATGQMVSGLSFGLSGYLVARLGFFSINAAVSWLPWVLLCLTPPSGAKKGQTLKLAVCLALMLLAGHAQTAWYSLLLAGGWSAFWAWRGVPEGSIEGQPPQTVKRFRDLFQVWFRFGLASALGAGIAAAQLFPTAEYLAQSQRSASVDFDFALNYSFWPWHLLNFLSPGFFGSPASGDYWGYGFFWEDAVYIGLLPLLLAVAALLRNLRRSAAAQPLRGLVWLLFGLFLAGLALGLGRFTPLYPWLYQHVPTFDMFQAPARWMLWGVFALSLLAGIGADRWHRPEGWGLYWTRLGVMGALAVSVGAGLAWINLGEISPSFIRATAVLGFLGAGAGALSLTAPPDPKRLPPDHGSPPAPAQVARPRLRLIQFSPPPSRPFDPSKPYPLAAWQWGVAVWIALDLLIAGWGLNPPGALRLYEPARNAQAVQQMLGESRLYIPRSHESWLKYKRFLRADTFDPGEDWLNLREVFLPNTNLLDRIALTNNFDPLLPGRYAEWLEMLEQAAPPVHAQMLELMDVGAVQTLHRMKPGGVSLQPLESRWARLVFCPRPVANPGEARGLILNGELDFDREAVLEGGGDYPESDCGRLEMLPESAAPLVRSDRSNPNRIDLEIETPATAWLVLSEVWYPGWRAFLDGEPAPILRANYLFRAVQVPPGRHQVLMVYQPLSFWTGAAVSLLAVLILLALALLTKGGVRGK